MNEATEQDSPASAEPTNSEVMALLNKMKQQLDFLERKLDSLLNQSTGKFFGEKRYPDKGGYPEKRYPEKRFPKPAYSARPFDSRREKGEGDRPERPGRGKNFEYQGNFKKRGGEQNKGFSHTKKPFFKRKER